MKGCLKVVAIIIAGFFTLSFIGGFIAYIFGDKTQSVESEDSAKVEAVQDTTPKIFDRWFYNIDEDEMTQKVTTIATIKSVNTVDLSFPYSSVTYAELNVRKSPRYGTDVYIKVLPDANLVGDNIKVRFDDGSMLTYGVNSAADGSANLIFLNSPQGFINRAKKAKLIRIELGFYSQGYYIFRFPSDVPLQWN